MLRKLTTSTALTWVVVLFVLPLPFLATLRLGLGQLYVSMIGSIGLGVIAYTWMLTAVYLAGRPRWLDRWVGLPHMYMIHGVVSLLAIGFAFIHKQLLPTEGLTKLLGETGLYLFIGLAVYSLVFMAGWLSQRVSVIKTIKRALERVFRHELSVWIHRLNLVAVAIIFLHVQSIDFIRADLPFIILFDTVTAAVFAWYFFSKMRQLAGHYRARVSGLRQVGERTYELSLTLADAADSEVRARGAGNGGSGRVWWHPGDFTFIRFPNVRGLREYHPFSIVSLPAAGQGGVGGTHGAADTSGAGGTGDAAVAGNPATSPATSPAASATAPATMVFDIRTDGDFTGMITDLQIGDQALILPPFGRYEQFIEEHAAGSPLVMLAGGIGVTPLLSVLSAYANSGRRITFLYGTRTRGQLIYADSLEELGRRNSNVHVELHAGTRFTAGSIAHTFGRGSLYLIAGPYGMQRSWRKLLLGKGVNADDIYYEPFSM